MGADSFFQRRTALNARVEFIIVLGGGRLCCLLLCKKEFAWRGDIGKVLLVPFISTIQRVFFPSIRKTREGSTSAVVRQRKVIDSGRYGNDEGFSVFIITA